MSSSGIRWLSPSDDGVPDLSVELGRDGLDFVGFEVVRLSPGTRRVFPSDELERCFVPLSGQVQLGIGDDEPLEIGGRSNPFDSPPDAIYVPYRRDATAAAVGGPCDLAVCSAPGGGAFYPYVIESSEIEIESRGVDAMEREVRPILMGDRPAHSLLVVEVLTPAAHWSSYPPHKHDCDDPPRETFLEETYYHRIDPPQGFGFQRVYIRNGGPEATVSFRDGDLVTVPFGYHTVSMPPGYRGYYLNVMAGPTRKWSFTDDPDHGWLRSW